MAQDRFNLGRMSSGQRGASLVEAVLFIAVSMAVAGGAISIFSGTWSSAQAEAEKKNISAIIRSIKDVGISSGQYPANIKQLLASSDRLRDIADRTTMRLFNEYGEPYAISATGSGRQVVVNVTGVPKKACTLIASSDLGQYTVKANNMPVPGQSLTLAKQRCTSNSNSLQFVVE